MAQPRDPKKPNPSAPNKAFVRKDQSAWKRAGWTSVPNSIIHNEDLPPIEAWAWAWMASHTETFEISGEKLWKANKHVAKRTAYDLLHNLETHGLLRRLHEVSDQGVPYIVYDLHPVPVPPEQRTAKPRKPRPKKSVPKGTFDRKKTQVSGDSRPAGNPTSTSGNEPDAQAGADAPGFSPGWESGPDQQEHGDPASGGQGGSFSPGVSLTRVGESYKEEKTNEQDQPTNAAPTDAPPASEADRSSNDGWLDDQSSASKPDPDGVRVLRNLPYGVGDGLSSKSVAEWSHVVGAALRAGLDERVVIEKLTSALPDGDRARRVRIVVGARLPDLKATVEHAPQQSAEREQSTAEKAHAKVDRMASAKDRGAREAAGLLGEIWNPEQYRGNADAVEWHTKILPRVAQEFVEQRRDALVAALTSNNRA